MLSLPPSQRIELVVCFATERPVPGREITLDLSEALPLPDGQCLPLIRFRAARWSYGFA